jgi:FHS family L-fucose permease-like MFS transporter
MSVMFPTIYGLALDGLTPNDAKLGSAGLIFAIVGGALMPPLQGGIIDTGNLSLGFGWVSESLSKLVVIPLQSVHAENVRASFVLPLVCFVVIAVYGFLAANHGKK